MKWCTTGGPVLHLGRCCGTPQCGNWKRSRTQGCGCSKASIYTRCHLMLQFSKAKKKRKRKKMLQYDIYRAFWKAVRPPTPTSMKGSYFVRCFCANRLRSTFSQHCSSQCAKREAMRTRTRARFSPRQAKEKRCSILESMAHYFELSIM